MRASKFIVIAILFSVLATCASFSGNMKQYDVHREEFDVREGNGIIIGRIGIGFRYMEIPMISFGGLVSVYTIDKDDGFFMLQMPPIEVTNNLHYRLLFNNVLREYCLCFEDSPLVVQAGRTSIVPFTTKQGVMDPDRKKDDEIFELFRKKYPQLAENYPVLPQEE